MDYKRDKVFENCIITSVWSERCSLLYRISISNYVIKVDNLIKKIMEVHNVLSSNYVIKPFYSWMSVMSFKLYGPVVYLYIINGQNNK